MKFFDNNEDDPHGNYPSIDDISVEMPAVSEYCAVTRLPDLFRQAGSDTLPVIDVQGRIIGIVSEYDLAKVVPELSISEYSYQCDIKVLDIMTKQVWTEKKNTNIKELFNKINDMHTRVIPIVDKDNYYTGNSITRTSVITYLTRLIKPNSLGGLATPLGVYITDGKHQAGAGNIGLFLTGISIGTILLFIEQVFGYVYKYFDIDITNTAILPVAFLLQIISFIFLLRLTPLAKIHAAEHQTINAIEKGLPLTLETVKLQPREHVRCGTNLMVLFIGLQIIILTFVGYLSKIEPLFQFIYLFAGFMFVFSNWRKWGMWLQKYFTTVKAPDSYILNGIKVGEEILHKYKEDLDAKPASFLRKVWCMSIIQIIAGFISIQWLFGVLSKLIFKII